MLVDSFTRLLRDKIRQEERTVLMATFRLNKMKALLDEYIHDFDAEDEDDDEDVPVRVKGRR